MCGHEQTASYGNAIQQAGADELIHEQKHLMQNSSDMVHLALEQKSQKEVRKAKKSMDEMAAYIRALDKRCCKMEKKMQELSEKVYSLRKMKNSKRKN